MMGPGKYDDLCSMVRQSALAEGAVIIVVNGKHGAGFSCQLPPEHLLKLPGILRQLAADIESDGFQGV